MKERISDEQLGSWADRNATELRGYVGRYPGQRGRVEAIEVSIKGIAHRLAGLGV